MNNLEERYYKKINLSLKEKFIGRCVECDYNNYCGTKLVKFNCTCDVSQHYKIDYNQIRLDKLNKLNSKLNENRR